MSFLPWLVAYVSCVVLPEWLQRHQVAGTPTESLDDPAEIPTQRIVYVPDDDEAVQAGLRGVSKT